MRILLELVADAEYPRHPGSLPSQRGLAGGAEPRDRVQLVDGRVVEPTVKHLTFLVDGALRASLGLYEDNHHDLIGQIWPVEGEEPHAGFVAW